MLKNTNRLFVFLLGMVLLLGWCGAANAVTPQIAAGGSSSFAIDSQGNLFSWGSTANGVLGIGSITQSLVPVQVTGGGQYVQVALGDGFAVGLRTDGSLWAWGRNNYGQLGDGTTTDQSSPKQVGTGYSEVAAGQSSTYALKNDGTLWAWGDNRYGQLGDGTITNNQPNPKQIGAGYSAVSAGLIHTLALKTDGTLWAWGFNPSGQLGDGTTTDKSSPEMIGNGFSKVFAGSHSSFAIKSDGTLWAWGWNGAGNLGDGTYTNRLSPVQIGTGYTAVAANEYYTVALKTDGTVREWGMVSLNSNGLPQQFGSGYVEIATDTYHTYTLAIKSDGTLWAWGGNNLGQLGDGTTTTTFQSPVQIGSGFISIAAGAGSISILNMAIKSDGSLWSWGTNNFGELGIASPLTQATPVKVGGGYQNVITNSDQMDSANTAAIKTDGSLWTWGSNQWGQLGNGTHTYSTTPVQIGSGYSQVAVGLEFMAALKTDGSLWTWGVDSGFLGNGHGFTLIPPSVLNPTMIGNGYTAVAAGDLSTYAIKTDGTLWAWGYNATGTLGDGTTATATTQNSPEQIGTGFSAISARGHSAFAFKQDGTLWAWGNNTWGQLGDGTTTNRLSPVPIPGNFVSIAPGRAFSAALKADGSLWAWGTSIRWGGLGLGLNLPLTPTPQQIATGFSAVAVGNNSILAEKTDGTLWAWGDNAYGENGDGTFAQHSAPVQVVNSSANGFLSLTSSSAPAKSNIPFFVSSTGGITDTSATVNTTTKFNAADVGKQGAVYVTAMVPPGSLGVASTQRAKFAAQAANSSVMMQLTPSGWQQVTNGQLIPYATGVLGDQLAAQSILNNADTTNLKGAQFCLGYGASATDMAGTGRMRVVATIPDPNAKSAPASCLPVSDSQVFSYAAGNYPSLFSGAVTGAQVSYQGNSYDYKYYSASQNYLAVDTSGMVYVMGPVSGGAIKAVGAVSSFADAIYAWIAQAAKAH